MVDLPARSFDLAGPGVAPPLPMCVWNEKRILVSYHFCTNPNGTPTDQLPVGRYSRDEVDEADVVDVVWTSKFGGELAQRPDEHDVAQWNQVEDKSGECEHDDGQT